MALEIAHKRSSSASMTSTVTANNGPPAHLEEPNENPLATNDATVITDDAPLAEGNSPQTNLADPNGAITENESPPEIPPKLLSVRSESRDVSVCSRNTRDSLRRNVSLRSNTFTESERLFLEQLTVDGSDRDVEKALHTVEDQDLFFEYATPRHLKHNHGNEPEIGLDINESNSSGADDATRDGEAASVATSERRGLNKVVTSSLTSSSRTDTSNNSIRASRSSNKSAAPPVPSTILGSQRRREILERRRSDSSLSMATLWRAHETGLAVTSIGSQRSLLQRESSISSVGSNMSGLSILFGNRPHPGAAREDVFRSDDAAQKDGDGKNRRGKSQTTPNTGKPPRQFPPPKSFAPMVRRTPHRRSKSAILFSRVKSMPKISERAAGAPTAQARAKSFGKRRSVTFNHIDEELEYDKDLETTAITPVNAVDTIPKRSQKVRRAVSDSQIADPVEFEDFDQSQEQPINEEQRRQLMQRDTSNSSIPSLHHGTPIRQDSIASIASLHHGNPLRDSMSPMGQSTSSIPSLHQGNSLRDSMTPMGLSISSIPSLHQGNPLQDSMSMMGQSTSSIPSLHQGNPLQDSMSMMGQSTSSIPSLHHGHPLRDSMSTIRRDSAASFASLHHGNPIRQESMSSIPSLHHGKPIRQDSVASSVPPNSLTQNQMIQQFGVTEDVAAAWLELASSNPSIENGEKRSRTACTLPSLPDDVQIPYAATAQTAATTMDDGDEGSMLTPTLNPEAISGLLSSTQKPVFFRQASRNIYEGEGVEVTELDDRPLDRTLSDTDSYYYQYQPDTDVFRTASPFPNHGSIRTAGSFDDVSLFSSFGQQQRTSEVFREIRRSLSDDTLSLFVGQNKEFLLQIPSSTDGTTSDTFVDEITVDGESTCWEMDYATPANGRFDCWSILQDEYANGYGGAGTLGFKILGTSVSDESAQPHVLSPPLMESLQAFLPPIKSGENFYLKYSMIRDGASLQTLLKRARGIKYSILAVETIDGEVFGSFTGQAWRKSWNYFGTGESFLWRMRHSRLEKTNGILDQAQKESEIDVYPYTEENDFIQLCTHDRIAVGGGSPEDASSEKKSQNGSPSSPLADHDWGFGLALQSDLLQGSSSPCLTFGSPSLCKAQPMGERFEVINVELWTMTPCSTEEDAERLELGKLFLGSTKSNNYVNNSLAPSYTY